ncbi:MAG: hypothetical protein K5857_05485 [Lachnospiraceae bacterium]|nr:hypothetical protein [Lachnospiraceae bacterium]
MKTVLIDCSPKKKLSVSGFLAWFTGLFIKGTRVREKLRNRRDHERILETVRDADNIVFVTPLYVDGVPSHVLPFLKEMEKDTGDAGTDHRIYVIANNGFIEGRQNEPLMQIMENFCARSNNTWCGGIGIGGGVMLNVMRIMIMVYFVLMVFGVWYSIRFKHEAGLYHVGHFLKQFFEVCIFGCGIILFDIRLARSINNGEKYGKHYTRVMLPSFIFIPLADIFFVIISILNGGLFKGWLKKKMPTREKAGKTAMENNT